MKIVAGSSCQQSVAVRAPAPQRSHSRPQRVMSRVHVRDGEDEDRRRLVVPVGRRDAGTEVPWRSVVLLLEAAVKQRPRIDGGDVEEDAQRESLRCRYRGAHTRGRSDAAAPIPRSKRRGLRSSSARRAIKALRYRYWNRSVPTRGRNEAAAPAPRRRRRR